MAMMAMTRPHGAGYQQGFAEQALGTGLSGFSGALGGASSLVGSVAGLAGTAQMAAGIGGAGYGLMTGAGLMQGAGMGTAALSSIPYLGSAIGMAGGIGMMGIGGGLALGAGAASEVYGGFQQRQSVNQALRRNFGTTMGVGGGRGGMGFSTQEMGGISTMMREMSGNDMFTQFDELTRVMDRTSEMGLYRGVQSAREFREKFRKTVDTLKEIAQTMHTSLEGATQFMEQQRNQGFFSGQEISASLLNSRLMAGATGMSQEQMTATGQMGTQIGRSMGMLGRSGAMAAQKMAGNVSLAMRMGTVSDEMIAEATGGLTGGEGAQAFSGRMMQVTNRFLARGAGRALMAGLWDPETGGIDQDRLRQAASGGLSFREALRSGRANIRGTGGRRSEFFSQEERIRGKLMSSGMGPEAVMGMLGQHMERQRGLSLDDPIMQRWVRRRLKVSQGEVELMAKMSRALPELLQEQGARFGQQIENEAVLRARKGAGLEGFRRRISQVWEQDVLNPLRQAGDDMTTAFSEAVDQAVMDLEGRVSTRVSAVGRERAIDIASTGKSRFDLGASVRASSEQAFKGFVRSRPGAGAGGFFASLGRATGARGGGVGAEIIALGGTTEGLTEEQMVARRDALVESSRVNLDDLGLSATQVESLTRDVERAVLLKTSPMERGLFARVMGTGSGELTVEGRQESIREMREEQISAIVKNSPEFRRATKGLSAAKKMKLAQEIVERSRLKGTDFNMGKFAAGGGANVSDLGRDLGRLDAFRAKEIGNIRSLFAPSAAAGPTGGIGMGRGGSGLGGPPPGVVLDAIDAGDIEGLLDATRDNPSLRMTIQDLATGTPEQKENARMNLILAGSGEGEGGGLSERQRVAARALGASSGERAEDIASSLSNVLAADNARDLTNALRPNRRRANDMLEIVSRNREAFEEIAGVKGSAALNKLLRLQASAKTREEAGEVSAARRELLSQLAGTDEGADLAAQLRHVRGGEFLAGELERAGSIVERLKRKAGIGKTREFLSQTLGTKASQALRGMMRKIQRGELTSEQAREILKKSRIRGISDEQLESALGVAEGGVDMGEVREHATETATRAGARLRVQGARDEERDLPSLAKKQIAHLATMQNLLGHIAKKQGITINIDKEGNVKTGGNTLSPSGGATSED
jgi:hypothetical protein